jgi:hypothetical protein
LVFIIVVSAVVVLVVSRELACPFGYELDVMPREKGATYMARPGLARMTPAGSVFLPG